MSLNAKTFCCLMVLFLASFAAACAAAEETQAQERVYDLAFSLTTGLPTDKAYRPVTVNLDNEEGARPIVGIGDADVVYEMPVYYGGYTRYTAVYNDTVPEQVEGVRSARIVHVDLYRDWGGAFIYAGVQEASGTNVYDYMKKISVFVSFDSTKRSAKDYFTRDEDRQSPHNLRCALSATLASEMYDIEPEPHAPLYFDAEDPTLGEERALEFAIRYRKGYLPSYQYDEQSKTYTRYYNWEPMLDADGSAVTCQNVIVMHVNMYWYDGESDRPMYRLTRGGTCDYFIGGTHFTGTFERARISQNTKYLDEQGNDVRFLPGKTYIQLVDEKTSVEILG